MNRQPDQFFPGMLWDLRGAAALEAVRVASRYRETVPGAVGWVFVHEGEAFEHGEELGGAGIWGPGVLAVSAEGLVLLAVGGDNQTGALGWQCVNASDWRGSAVVAEDGLGPWLAGVAAALGVVAVAALLWAGAILGAGSARAEAGNSNLTNHESE
jgi:hypothetical protein